MAQLAAAIDIQSGWVLSALTLFVFPVAATAFACSGPAWRSIGKGGRFGIMHTLPPPRLSQPVPPIDKAAQAAETRQMLEAKSYRRLRRGEAPLDVEAEAKRLLASPAAAKPSLDEKLRAEVRELVIARNERRMSRGEEPLDVEAETDRQCADFIGLGD
jgi:hypothetical protein